MAYEEVEGTSTPIKSWTIGVPFEHQAKVQLRYTAMLPIVGPHIAVMPDVHVGIGSTVGSVIPTRKAIIPACVGVDIGCGMMAIRTNLTSHQISDNAKDLFDSISKAVPHGGERGRDTGNWNKVPDFINDEYKTLEPELRRIIGRHGKVSSRNSHTQLGTLGGGNHFIEVCIDEADKVWIMLHSGSRGVGNKIGSYFIELAKDEMDKLDRRLPSRDLAYFEEGTQHFNDYVDAVHWAQEYARINREMMMESVIKAIRKTLPIKIQITDEAVNCHHNYVQKENHFGEDLWITRKGAVSASEGTLGIIPGCLAKGTRVLMSSGSYKNIEDIKPGDEVITGHGKRARVADWFDRGEKETITYRSNQFWNHTSVTPDHLHLIGDLSGMNWSAEGRSRVLDRHVKNGEDKIRWSSMIEAPDDFVMLLPRNIDFEEKTDPIRVWERDIDPSYEFGYVVGTFLGDGTSFYEPSSGGQVSWSFGINENEIAEKTASHIESSLNLRANIYSKDKIKIVVVHDVDLAKFFEMFGKRHNKHLPEFCWRTSTPFLLGVMDGMVDSDGHFVRGMSKFTNTSTKCIELFGLIHHMLRGYFPSVSIRPPSSGGLKGCDLENCNTSYRSSSLAQPLLVKNYQLVQPIGMIGTSRGPFREKFERNTETKSMRVYDIELEGDDPSFIANNVIVHNSMGAKSYIVRGKGNPDSFNSCSHGAGRVMARGVAKQTITLAMHREATKGIECRKDKDVIDESPAAYKDIDVVMHAQQDLVEVVHTLHQVVCVKG